MDTAEGATLLVAADRRELDGVRARCAELERLRLDLEFAARGRFAGRRVLLAANGPGPWLATQAVRQAGRCERLHAIVSTGVCGALDPALSSGDVFVAAQVRCLDTGAVFAARIPAGNAPYRSGRLVSVDRVVQSAVEKTALRASGEAVEMEAAAVAAEAQALGLPFYAVRVVLDAAAESFRLDYNALRGANGRFSRGRLLKAVLRRPDVSLPELLRLRRRLFLVSQILGEFLAGCEF